MNPLAALLAKGPVHAPGAYDGLSARLAARAGAHAVYMTGFGLSGSVLGMPDVGLLTATEMAARAGAMAEAAGVPLIADGDGGHGGVLNVARTVRLYEAAGAACIQVEDQAFPKRCGHMRSKVVVDRVEAVARVEAAVAARSDMLVMARTDARATDGMDEALRRAEAFARAGADILFVEAPRDEGEMRRLVETLHGAPLCANMVEDGKTPYRDASALHAMGFALVIHPVSTLLVAARALEDAYAALIREGRLDDRPRATFDRYNDLVGLTDLLPDA